MKKVLLVAVSLILCSMLCFANGSTESTATTSTGSGPIKIGSIMDLSGSGASVGRPNSWAVENAVKYVNEHGGVNGRMLELTTMDCKNDAVEGVTCYRKLVDETGVCAIIGPPLSNPAVAWVELSAEDKIPIVGHFMDESCTTNPDTGKAYPYMFLCEPSCAVQSNCIAKYGMEKLGIKKVAALYNPGNSFAKSQAKPFLEYIKKHGGEVVAEETFTWSDKDYSAQAIKIVAAKPDCVYLGDYLAQSVTAYDALRDAGFEGPILGANTLAPPFGTMVRNNPHDVYFLQNYDMMNPKKGNINELVLKHMKETGTDAPQCNAGFGWDAVTVLVDAMKKAKDPTNGEEVAALLEKTDGVLLSSGDTITIDAATHRPNNMGMFIADYTADKKLEIVGFEKEN